MLRYISACVLLSRIENSSTPQPFLNFTLNLNFELYFDVCVFSLSFRLESEDLAYLYFLKRFFLCSSESAQEGFIPVVIHF